MKKMMGKVLLLLLAVCSVFLCVSCGELTKPADGTESESDTDAATEEVFAPLALATNGKSEYTIYYPEDNNEIFACAKRVADAFKNYTGADIKCKGDLLNRGEISDPDALEILVGPTNRPETATVKEQLAPDEYAVCQVRNKLVILGYNLEATGSAVDYFIKNYFRSNAQLSFGKTDGNLTFEQAWNYHHTVSHYIKKLTIGGADISECQIVIPERDSVEEYIAKLLKIHIASCHGYELDIVTDDAPAKAHEIRIGKTARTTATAEAGTYNVEMRNGSLEAICNVPEGYGAMIRDLRDNIIPYSRTEIDLDDGDGWDGNDTASYALNMERDLRILYHNVWGNRNSNIEEEPNYPAMRPDLMLALYACYDPDVICWQESQSSWRNDDDCAKLFTWLRKNYTEVVFSDGVNNELWVRKTGFEVIEKKYFKARNGDKGTTTAIVKVTSGANNGKIFAVMSTHFSADNGASRDSRVLNKEATLAEVANIYRTEDAQKGVEAMQWVQGLYPDIDIFFGGDLNTQPGTDPYRTLTDAGFKDVRSINGVQCRNIAPGNGFPTSKYIKSENIFQLNTLSVAEGSEKKAIDHVFCANGIPKTLTITRYEVLTSTIACTTSDHLPHFIDLDWK